MQAVGKLARAFQAEVRLVHVAPPDPDFVGYEPGPESVRDNVAQTFRSEHKQLQELADTLAEQDIAVKPLLIQGPTVAKLVEEVRRYQADLVLAGSHGHSALHDLLLGGVASGLLRQCPVPIMSVPALQRDEQ